jgi:biotin carboxylase
MKTLWIVSGGAEAVPGIIHAKELGYYVVVSDGNPKAPGVALADDFVEVSTYDVDATTAEARRYHHFIRQLDGIMCIAADVPLTVATAAYELGLPGIKVETAQLATNKLAMKERFAAMGVPIPWFSHVESIHHLRNLIEQYGFPLIIKPVDSRGARGVLRLTKSVDLAWAFNHAQKFSPSAQVMVEEFLDGPQISTESVLLDGKGFTPGFADRNYELLETIAPYVIENGGHQPSILTERDQQAVKRCAENAGLALGVQNGIVKGDIVMTSEGPKVIEIATRLSGGWFSTDQIPLGTGVDLIGVAIKLALGEKVSPNEVTPRYQKGVAIRYFFPKPGRIVAIRHLPDMTNMPWVYRLGFFLGPGDFVESATNHTKRVGYVITVGNDRLDAISKAETIIKSVQIETVDC